MKINKIISTLTTVILIAVASLGVCQNAPAKFNVEFKYKTKIVPDTLNIDILQEGNIWDNLTSLHVKVDQGHGSFQLSSVTKPTMFFLSTIKNGKYERLGRYFAQPSDNIKISIYERTKRDSLAFSGIGSEKYNLSEQILKLYDDFTSAKRSQFKSAANLDSGSMENYLSRWSNFAKEWTFKKSTMIENYQAVDPKMKSLLKHEYFGIYNEWVGTLDYYVRHPNDVVKNASIKTQIKRYFDLYNNELSIAPDSVSVLSAVYYMDLVVGQKLGLILNSDDEMVTVLDYYNFIKKNYSGIIRERLFTELFTGKRTLINIQNNDPAVCDSLIVDAGKLMVNPYYKELLNDRFKLQKGKRIKYAEFLGLNGKSIKLDDLQGKVVLIDVWGTGCIGCAEFHEMFRSKVLPKINTASNFITLSVCLDKTKEKWVKALSTGKYASEDDLLASTGKLGIDHPFFKYYGFRSIPLILLADKNGNIISKLTGTESENYLVTLINMEVKKAYSK